MHSTSRTERDIVLYEQNSARDNSNRVLILVTKRTWPHPHVLGFTCPGDESIGTRVQRMTWPVLLLAPRSHIPVLLIPTVSYTRLSGWDTTMLQYPGTVSPNWPRTWEHSRSVAQRCGMAVMPLLGILLNLPFSIKSFFSLAFTCFKNLKKSYSASLKNSFEKGRIWKMSVVPVSRTVPPSYDSRILYRTSITRDPWQLEPVTTRTRDNSNRVSFLYRGRVSFFPDKNPDGILHFLAGFSGKGLSGSGSRDREFDIYRDYHIM